MNIIDKIRDKVVGERTDALIEKNAVSKYEHIMRYQFAAKEAGHKVLDIGCGFGYGSKMLFDSNRDVTSMDVSDKAIEYAKKKYPGPKYICADASVLPFPDSTFDSVTTFDVIEHLKVPEDLLPEIYRVLKPGGTMFISTPNPRHLMSILKHYLLAGHGRKN